MLGDVRGTLEETFYGNRFYAQFLGIPYAEAPLGGLRFAPPKPLSNNWNGTVREANLQPSACLQIDPTTEDVFGAEDCLLLNIYIPRKNVESLIYCSL